MSARTPAATRAVGADAVFADGVVRTIGVGILDSEQGVTQRVRFSIALELVADLVPEGDVPAVSYVDIVDAIDAETTRHTPLLEQLGERVAARLLAHPGVARAVLTIEKLDILDGNGILGVRMVREKAA